MPTPLANQLLAWRVEIAVAGGYLQAFYQPFDRKQWDRAERVTRRACEVITRNHSECLPLVREGVAELQSRGVEDDCLAEQEAWRRIIQALMCLASLFGMVEVQDRSAKGLQGWRTDTTRSLGTALQASQTAFPEGTLKMLAELALENALQATERILAEDLRESGTSHEMEANVLAHAAIGWPDASKKRDRMPELFAKLGSNPKHDEIVAMNRSLHSF